MSFRLVFNVIGKLLALEAGLMLPSLGMALYYRDGGASAILWSMLALLVLGLPAMLLSRPDVRDVRAKEGLVAVGLAWVLLPALGALPFMFSGVTRFYWDALFETVSGFTTTGASIFSQVEGIPRGILFWRSFTHWVGGMGVLILTLAVMPRISGRGSVLARAESPGPTFSKMTPRMTDTARLMYAIYAAMTLVLTVLLLLSGLPLYDALIHAMGTAGTGGFSNRNLSVGAYGNVWAEMVIMLFMLLFGMNFTVYFRLLRGEGLKAFQSEEVRFYWLLALGSTLLIALNVLPRFGNFLQALRYSGFHVSSIMSTTGYATADFVLWPQFSNILLLLLMLVGACAGSTAGGMKVVRAILLGKVSLREISQSVSPRKVRLVALDGKTVGEETLRSVLAFFFIYIFILLAGTLAASTDGHDFVTCFSAAAACLSNIGPGLGLVGPAGNYDIFSPHVKVLLSFLMIAGRLEFIPLLALFHPAIWKKGH